MKEKKHIDLEKISDEKLMEARLCDLGLAIQGTQLEGCVEQLYKELSEKGITFHPRCYLADEWLCPDGEPVIGIAFFLAHPRLKKLEQKIMLEAEGAERAHCMRLLRHEAGHAINYAYLLHKRKKWNRVFGPFSAEYGDSYKYRPYSKSFVRHLEEWYAQYHPDEDFSETFAVWLDPESNWREKYKGWKALEKLQYVDSLMKGIAGKPPKKAKGDRYWDVSRLKSTLKTYYRNKRRQYAVQYADFHDFSLNRIFRAPEGRPGKNRAYKLIRKHRKEIMASVAMWTGEKKYVINRLLRNLIDRSKELGLEAGPDEAADVLNTTAYVAAQIMNYIYTGRYKRRK